MHTRWSEADDEDFPDLADRVHVANELRYVHRIGLTTGTDPGFHVDPIRSSRLLSLAPRVAVL